VSEGKWAPKISDWYTAVVDRAHHGYYFAHLTNYERVFLHHSRIRVREEGHTCLRVGDEVSVRLERNDHNATEWLAVEVALAEREETNLGVVVRWTRDRGVVKRDCGCSLTAESYTFTFNPGDRVELYEIEPNPRGGFVARDTVPINSTEGEN